jgi:hypothetical protein
MDTIQIQLPTIIEAGDYHEFDVILDVLKQFGVKGVRFFEVSWPGRYAAVFYTGTKRNAEKWLREERPLIYAAYKGDDDAEAQL